jgi:hypothetical protein
MYIGHVKSETEVFFVADRGLSRRQNLPKQNHNGRETRNECSTCNVALCVDIFFELYHTQKHYVDKYIADYLH